MKKVINVLNKKFTKLTVISFNGKSKHGCTMYNCLCDCGNNTIVSVGNLISGNTKSCGCLNKVRPSIFSIPPRRCQSNKSGREYISWKSIIGRIQNSNNPYYKNYGGRFLLAFINGFKIGW